MIKLKDGKERARDTNMDLLLSSLPKRKNDITSTGMKNVNDRSNAQQFLDFYLPRHQHLQSGKQNPANKYEK